MPGVLAVLLTLLLKSAERPRPADPALAPGTGFGCAPEVRDAVLSYWDAVEGAVRGGTDDDVLAPLGDRVWAGRILQSLSASNARRYAQPHHRPWA